MLERYHISDYYCYNLGLDAELLSKNITNQMRNHFPKFIFTSLYHQSIKLSICLVRH